MESKAMMGEEKPFQQQLFYTDFNLSYMDSPVIARKISLMFKGK